MEALIQPKLDVTDVGRGFFYVSEKTEYKYHDGLIE